MTASSTQLRVEHIRKEYAGGESPRVVLADVSFSLAAGETLAIMGPSGVGKSTLLHIIGSLDRPTDGRVFLDDDCITSLPDHSLAAFRSRRVGFVFQDHHLLPQCTALENVLLPVLALARRAGAAERDRGAALLEAVGVGGRMHAFPAELSGGERQRVALARALINNPPLVLADEPTGNLDSAAGDAVADLLILLAAQRRAIVIAVTHNPALAERFRRRAQLQAGVLRES